jgi:cation transport regulator ChaC
MHYNPPAAKEELSPATYEGQRVIVICGSMSHFALMLQLQRQLRVHGVDSITPEDERHLTELSLSERDYSKMKRRMSERYFRIIRRRNVYGILVANFEKHGRANYIGPNTLAEIAIAVNARKKIYLFQDIYTELKDELAAWEALSLHGDVTVLLRDLEQELLLEQRQLTLNLPDFR